MILNLTGTQLENGDIRMVMPDIVLDHRQTFQIGLHRIHMIVGSRKGLTLQKNDLLLLSTNLVERSSLNPLRSIVYFNYENKNNHIETKHVDSVMFHNLNLYELINASFSIKHFTGTDVNLDLRDIFLQLEIQRENTYGRI